MSRDKSNSKLIERHAQVENEKSGLKKFAVVKMYKSFVQLALKICEIHIFVQILHTLFNEYKSSVPLPPKFFLFKQVNKCLEQQILQFKE